MSELHIFCLKNKECEEESNFPDNPSDWVSGMMLALFGSSSVSGRWLLVAPRFPTKINCLMQEEVERGRLVAGWPDSFVWWTSLCFCIVAGSATETNNGQTDMASAGSFAAERLS